MPFGINIRASGGAAPYWTLVDRVAALEAEPTVRALAYPPHITLAKYDDADAREIGAVVDALAETPSLTLTFYRLGSFDPGFLILWAAPKPEQALLDLHARAHHHRSVAMQAAVPSGALDTSLLDRPANSRRPTRRCGSTAGG